MTTERGWAAATRIAAGIVGALLVILVVTGLVLTFRYRPDVSRAYLNVRSLEQHPLFTARRVHRVAAVLFMPAVAALAVTSIGLFVVRRDRGSTAFSPISFTPIAFSLLACGSALAAFATGLLLPWDQLSLWAVTVGTDMRGYTGILGGRDVKYVLVGSSEFAPATFSRWFWVHSVVVPVFLFGMLAAVIATARRGRAT